MIRSNCDSKASQRGFTLFETLVAMFVMLIGLMGIFSVFGSGVTARLQAQEMIVSQELAQMWSNWIRFRLNNSRGGGIYLSTGALVAGARGSFYDNTGTFCVAPANDPANLPTYQKLPYKGYFWEITRVRTDASVVTWSPNHGTSAPISWDKRGDGNSSVPGALGAAPPPLTEVELCIFRGGRRYKFNYIFSGVGVKYDN